MINFAMLHLRAASTPRGRVEDARRLAMPGKVNGIDHKRMTFVLLANNISLTKDWLGVTVMIRLFCHHM